MQIEQIDAAEKALAKEFSDYLASVSREVIAPISANIARHQADVEQMLTKVAEARSGVESEFGRQRDYLNTVREQIDAIIKESELKIARLHSSSQALLDNSRQRIVSELTAVADQAGQTARKMGEENERTSGAIGDHHQALRRLTEENREATTRILENASVVLNRTFEAHRASLDGSASELLRRFDAIAQDVKQTTERLWSVHDETKTRLFADFSSFTESVRSQIEAIHDTLRRDISAQIDRKSEDVIKQVGAGITGHYLEQFSGLTTEIRNGLGRISESSRGQGEQINGAITKAVGDISKSIVESQAGAVGQLQRELASVKKLMGVIVVVVAALVSAGLFVRF
jgi:archaellum component FlaC